MHTWILKIHIYIYKKTFVNHLLKKIDGIFSEAIASLASMVVTTLKIVVSCINNTQSLSTGMFFLYIYIEGKSSSDAKSKSSGHWRMLEDPEFIIAIVVAQYVLSFLKPSKEKL
jgi:hypothetical protein